MTERDFPSFLRASLALTAAGAPALHAELAAALADAPLDVEVDGARCGVRARAGGIDVGPPGGGVRVITTAAAICALLRGELTLLDAVLSDRIELIGAVPDVARFDRALFLYLNATVRAPGHDALQRRYLELA